MKITVNGEEQETQSVTLAQLCDALGYGEQRIATAVNGDFVAAEERAQVRLRQHDKVEIVAPRQGG
ncbi:MAG: sulfur carrier protein ThiS [Dichotomicrobium sp.]